MILQTLCDSARCQRNLTGYEIFAAALRLMVKQDTVYCKHVVSFSIFLGDPEAILLRNCIGAVRVEGCCLSLRNLFYLAVQLGSGSLINFGFLVRPRMRTASRIRSTPIASTSPEYSGTSKETCTWDCAARL